MRRAAVLVAALAVGCGSPSPTAPVMGRTAPMAAVPTAPIGAPSIAVAPTLVVSLVDVLTDAPVIGATVTTDGGLTGLSGPDGQATLAGRVGSAIPATVVLTVTSADHQPRTTQVATSQGATVSLIPASFDLASFDEQARQPALLKWATAPALVLVSTVADFTSLSADTFLSSGAPDTPANLAERQADLEGALTGWSAGRLRFASETVSAAGQGPDTYFNVLVPGQITVVVAFGLAATVHYDGYTRILTDGTTITGALVVLDAGNEQADHRHNVRVHELGHAVGRSHVFLRPDIMDPEADTNWQLFDTNASAIVAQRPAGNASPDADPGEASTQRVGVARWSGWMR